MLRRISTKLVLAVLAAVALPFVAFAFFIDVQMAERLTRHVVQQALLGLVKDLAGQIDYFVDEREADLDMWADLPETHAALDHYLKEQGRGRLERPHVGSPEHEIARWRADTMASWSDDALSTEALIELQPRTILTHEFDRYLDLKKVYDLVILVAADGRLVACTSKHPGIEGAPHTRPFLEFLFAQDFSHEEWFQKASAGSYWRVDHHVSPYHVEIEDPDPAWDYQLGFATPVFSKQRPGEVRGVLYALVSWWYVQGLVSTQVIIDAFRGLVEEDRTPSPYAWLWANDADTILAHPERGLYKCSVTRDLGLGQLTRAVLEDDDGWGLYPEYEFNGKRKNAAFRRCSLPPPATLAASDDGFQPPQGEGFGWVVGVGIDNDDIYSTADELRTLLLGGTAGVLVLAVCLTLFIARRTTGPIRELQASVRRVAEGDLDTRFEIRSKDEIGALAEDLDRMTHELKDQRERIVKAEKDAAWKEMARQIAHDIKNPLTPITLSLDLLERARRERAPGSNEILERTMGLMRRQVENLRQIANDFYEFTGGRKANPRPLELVALLEEVLHLHDAWAVERGVTIQREGAGATVWADEGKLRRVFVNLVSNALQAMPEGGQLLVETAIEDGRARVSIRDTGTGIASEARAHLFEPYFTTKSEGTGLGLAIARRSIEEMGGEIELVPAPDGVGTVARVMLQLAREDGA